MLLGEGSVESMPVLRRRRRCGGGGSGTVKKPVEGLLGEDRSRKSEIWVSAWGC